MYEYAAIWTIEADDGSTITFNDGQGLVLEEITGFDSPTIRTNVEDRPEYDGAVAGDFYMGRRAVTLRGRIVNVNAADRNLTVVQMQRTLRALRSSVTITSQPSGLPAMQATAKLESLRVTGGFVKEFHISMICADPLIYSQELHVQYGTGQTATTGVAFPMAFPMSFGGGSGAVVTLPVSNNGNIEVRPVYRIEGPIDDPYIENDTNGQIFYLDGVSLLAGEWVDIDTAAFTVVDDASVNLYGNVRYPDSSWVQLEPGGNVLELRGDSTASDAILTVTWRDAWV